MSPVFRSALLDLDSAFVMSPSRHPLTLLIFALFGPDYLFLRVCCLPLDVSLRQTLDARIRCSYTSSSSAPAPAKSHLPTARSLLAYPTSDGGHPDWLKLVSSISRPWVGEFPQAPSAYTQRHHAPPRPHSPHSPTLDSGPSPVAHLCAYAGWLEFVHNPLGMRCPPAAPRALRPMSPIPIPWSLDRRRAAFSLSCRPH